MKALTLEKQKSVGENLIRVLFFTLIISVMNATMFTVVLPTISKEFFLTSSQVSWMSTSYMIVYAIGTVTYGKLADQYRLKDLLTFGLLFMAIGSALGFLASEYWMIIAGRVLQAIGASVIPATAMIIPIRYFPPEKRGHALGALASGLALGTAIGPIVAGFTTSLLSWRYLFLISLATLLTLPFYRRYLDDQKGAAKKIDYIGGLLLASTTAVFLLAVTLGAWPFFLLSAILLALFLLRITFAPEPFIQPALFQNKKYLAGILITVIATAISFAAPFLVPQMLANVNQISPAFIGFVIFPGALASAMLGRAGGKLADKRGNAFLFNVAAVAQFIAFCLLSVLAGMSPLIILIVLIFASLGQTFMQLTLANTVSHSLSKEEAGVGMGMFQMLTFIAGATAMALFGKVLDIGSTSLKINPFLIESQGLVYSNIFAVLVLVLIVNALIFYKLLGRSPDNKL